MRIGLAVISLAAGGLAGPAFAADALLVDTLAPRIAEACVGSADGRSGTMSAAALGRAIFQSGYAPLVVQFDWVRSGGSGIGAVAVDKPAEINRKSVTRLRGLIAAWLRPDAAGSAARLPLADGGVEIRLSDGSAEVPRVLAAVLEGCDDGMTIRCVPRAARGDPVIPVPVSVIATAETVPARRLIVTRAPTDLTIEALLDRPSAEIAYTNNLDTQRETLSLTGTIGVVWREFALGDVASYDRAGGVLVRAAPMAFVQIEREGSTGDPDGTDNLALGFQVGGFVQTRPEPGEQGRTASHYFALNGRFLTDTRFASRSWSLAARVTPDLPLRGNDVPYEPIDGLSFRWLVSGTVDHLSNDRPGRKLDLIDAPSWTRLGFDATANVTLKLPDLGRLQLRADYGERYNLARGPGDAQRLSLRFQYLPDDHLSFGVAYDDGESFDLLTHASVIKAVFGIRR